jgi:hypothetical protein
MANDFIGKWRIFQMEVWGKDYFDMEVKAYISIDSRTTGEFQFSLVNCSIDGEIVKYRDGNRFEFTWDGNDECDPASGSGRVKLIGKNLLDGTIKFHKGGSSTFQARRVRICKAIFC